MARVDAMPAVEVVKSMAGVIDYYIWLGIPCARKWPEYHPRTPHAEEKLNQMQFGEISRHVSHLPAYVVRQYKEMAAGTNLTWRDIAISLFMGGAWWWDWVP